MHPQYTPCPPQKTCKQCGKTGGWELFYLTRGRPIGRCKECHKRAQALHRQGIVPTSLRKSAPAGMWACSRCKVLKPVAAFNRDTSKPRGHSYTCKECNKAYLQGRYHSEPDFRRRGREANLRRNFGISAEEFARLYEAQGRVCAICGQPGTVGKRSQYEMAPLYVDHCHANGHVRGLLCNKCNTGIGMFDDNPELLAQAIAYLAARAAPLPA